MSTLVRQGKCQTYSSCSAQLVSNNALDPVLNSDECFGYVDSNSIFKPFRLCLHVVHLRSLSARSATKNSDGVSRAVRALQLQRGTAVPNSPSSTAEHILSDSPWRTTYVTARIYARDGETLCPVVRSAHSVIFGGEDTSYSQNRQLHQFEQWLTFSVTVSELSIDSVVVLTLHGHGTDDGASSAIIGEAAFCPFSSTGRLKTGILRYPLKSPGNSSKPLNYTYESMQHTTHRPHSLNLSVNQNLEFKCLNFSSRLQMEEFPDLSDFSADRIIVISLPFVAPQGAVVCHSSCISLPPPNAELKYDAFQAGWLSAIRNAPSFSDPPTSQTWGASNLLASSALKIYENPAVFAGIRQARGRGVSGVLLPGSCEREKIDRVLACPLLSRDPLSAEEASLLWDYREYLTRNPKALVPLMSTVNWAKSDQRLEALRLLALWQPIEIADILILLSRYYKHSIDLRKHAIRTLSKKINPVIGCYLIELVQAVRYDVSDELASFLLSRSAASWLLANDIHWLMFVEATVEAECKGARGFLFTSLRERWLQSIRGTATYIRLGQQESLINNIASFYKRIISDPLTVRDRPAKIARARELLEQNQEGFEKIFTCSSVTDFSKSTQVGTVALPLHHGLHVAGGIVPDKTYLYKSNGMPLRLEFWLLEDERELNKERRTVSIIYKSGDDLRQDQFVLQIIGIMDTILRESGIDLQLTPYSVLATSPSDGLVEVGGSDSVTLSSALRLASGPSRGGVLAAYLSRYNSTEAQLAAAIERFTRSCAGYCVITFLLGIGDRHLENILISTDGRLFHIDFAYILGNDPRPFPPPMKITKEMVELLGGAGGVQYNRFKTLCCRAFNVFRKHSHLLLAILMLLVDSGLPQINSEPWKQSVSELSSADAVRSVDPRINIIKVQERLRLDLNDAEASQYLQTIITGSQSSVFGNIWDVVHSAAQAARN